MSDFGERKEQNEQMRAKMHKMEIETAVLRERMKYCGAEAYGGWKR